MSGKLWREEAIEALRQIFGERADSGRGLSAEECAHLSKVIQYSNEERAVFGPLVLENLRPFHDDFIVETINGNAE